MHRSSTEGHLLPKPDSLHMVPKDIRTARSHSTPIIRESVSSKLFWSPGQQMPVQYTVLLPPWSDCDNYLLSVYLHSVHFRNIISLSALHIFSSHIFTPVFPLPPLPTPQIMPLSSCTVRITVTDHTHTWDLLMGPHSAVTQKQHNPTDPGNSTDKLRHPRSDAYSAEQVLLNKQQIWCGGACLHCCRDVQQSASRKRMRESVVGCKLKMHAAYLGVFTAEHIAGAWRRSVCVDGHLLCSIQTVARRSPRLHARFTRCSKSTSNGVLRRRLFVHSRRLPFCGQELRRRFQKAQTPQKRFPTKRTASQCTV